MSAAMSKPGPTTTVLREGWFYLGTFLKNGKNYPDPETSTLMVLRVQHRRGPSGKVRVATDRDALAFPNEDALVEWIVEHDAEEMPSEADGNLVSYVPESFRLPAPPPEEDKQR